MPELAVLSSQGSSLEQLRRLEMPAESPRLCADQAYSSRFWCLLLQGTKQQAVHVALSVSCLKEFSGMSWFGQSEPS